MKTQSALINPVKLPREEDLTEAERHFVKCMAEGEKCEFGENCPQPGDTTAPVIHANVIHFFAWGGSEENPILGNTIYLQGAYVADALSLPHASINYALKFRNCYFPWRINIPYLECALLDFHDSLLEGGLAGDRMKIKNDVFMSGGFLAEDEVRLVGTKIGGGFYCNGGTFKKKEKIVTPGKVAVPNKVVVQQQIENRAINADRLEVGDDVFLTENFCADGAVNFIAAKIGGDLKCDGGKFIYEGPALVAESMELGGHLMLVNGFSTEGNVVLFGANIGGTLFCQGGTFKKGLMAQNMKVNGLLWRGANVSGKVNLSFASADVLIDDVATSWDNYEFELEGFAYSRLHTPGDVQARIDWLDKLPKGASFSPQIFEHAAKVFFAVGRDSDAREILLAKEERITQGQMPGWRRFARHWLWDFFAGYGYRIRRTVVASMALIALGWGIFCVSDYAGYIVPHQPLMIARMNDKAAGENLQVLKECKRVNQKPTEVVECLFPEYPRFNSLFYSADVFVPFFSLHQEAYWYPQPANIYVAAALKFWYWLEIIAGWLLTSLLVLSITGLLRPRQSSGDKE